MAIRLVRTIILVLLGIFLYTRIAGDTVLFYINERFVILTYLAAAGLVLVGAGVLLQKGGHEHEHEHVHGHSPGNGRRAWIGWLILSIPVLLGFLVPPQPLGADALQNRDVDISNLTSIAPPGSDEATRGVVSGERNIVDWLREFQSQPDPAPFQGQEAHVVGFVYRDDRFDPNSLMVSRFVVSCCVADAAPVGLIVQSLQASGLPQDQWIEVTGRFMPGVFDGFEIPILVADEIVVTEAPPQPYLYP